MYHVYENDYEFPLHWDSLDDAMTFRPAAVRVHGNLCHAYGSDFCYENFLAEN